MRSPSRNAALVSCVLTIFAIGIIWWSYQHKTIEHTIENAALIYRGRAEQGDAEAQRNLGNLYYKGIGVQQNRAEALRWYGKAAERGDASAEYKIGYMYDSGQGVSKNYAEAFRWYSKAAAQGDAKAQCGLGSMYYDGRGVPKNAAEAVRWYVQAADHGLAKAQYDLGYMYYHGEGVQVDRAQARIWYQKSADQGYENAQLALGLRSSGLSPLGAVTLSAMFLGCLRVLKGNIRHAQGFQSLNREIPSLVALLGLVYVGLSIYRVFHIFHSSLAVNAFCFVQNLVVGISIATAVSFFRPRSTKFLLTLASMLFAVINMFVITHHAFRHFAMTVRGFSVANGLLIGTLIPLAILFRRFETSGYGSR
jgi:hypothetical protein